MPNMSLLDADQVIKLAADEVNGALKVNVIATSAGGAATPILSGDSSGNEATVNSSGELLVHATLAVESIEIGKVDQGTGGVSAWKVDGSAVTQPVSATSLPLPTGASTAAKQPALGTAGSASTDVITVQGIASMTALKVDGSAVTQPISGTVTVTQATGTNLHTVIDSGSVTAITTGYANSQFVRNDYTGASVTTVAYTTLIASTSQAYQEMDIFDSSGQTLKIAFGAAASEVDQFLVYPGGNGRIRHSVPSGTRISIKAVSATASVGEFDLNLLG